MSSTLLSALKTIRKIRGFAMKLAKLLLVCLAVSPAGKVHAVPPPDAGVTIGGALIDDSGEPVTSVVHPTRGIYEGSDLGIVLLCNFNAVIETGVATNTFLVDQLITDCPANGFGGSIQLLDVTGARIKTTLTSPEIGETFLLEIISISRSTPESPISLTIGNFGFPIVSAQSLQVTPQIVDENGILLIEGPSKTSNSSGIGPYGGTLFSYVRRLDSQRNRDCTGLSKGNTKR